MLNTATLRDVLKEIFGVEDKYLLPLTDDQFVPTLDPKDKIGTWIGYMMLYKDPYARGFQAEPNAYMPISTKFRITFVGPQAEEFADSTLFWDMRTDVIQAFEAPFNSIRNRYRVECEGRKFYTVKDCAEYYNVPSQTMRGWVNGRLKMPSEWNDKGLKYIDE